MPVYRPTRRKTQTISRPAVVVLITIALLLVLWLVFRTSKVPAPTNTNTAENANESVIITNQTDANTVPAQTNYANAEFGFSLSYPSSWTVTPNESGTGSDRIANFAFGDGTDGVTLIVAPESMEGMIRESFSVSGSTKVTINGEEAEQLQGAKAKDGERVDLLFFRKNATLYVLNGPLANVERVGRTFRFTKE